MEVLKNYSQFSQAFKEVYAQTHPKILALEGIAEHQLDMSLMSKRYYGENLIDISIDNNANLHEGRSHGNFLSEVAKSNFKILGYHDLHDILMQEYGAGYANEIMRATWEGDLYFHDSTAVQVPYCWAYSSYFILDRGNFWGQLKSLPPHRARSFIDQVKEVTIELAQQIAGAVAVGDLFVCYSYFIKKDGLDIYDPKVRKEIENDFQSLVHTLNKKLRPSHQSPFSNVSIFDRPNLEQLFGELVFPDGSSPDYDLILEIQKIFCDWFQQGDPSSGLPYRFPVVTLNLRIDEDRKILDQEALDYYSEINLEKGCFNIYISSGNKIASCCRLINDLELAGTDSFGNGGVSLGSHRVVTLNLARLGKVATSYEHLLELLKVRLDQARDALNAHRKLISQRSAEGFLPFFKYDIMSMERLFSTFGVNGIYECLEQLGYSILSEQGKRLAIDLLETIRNYATECSKKYGVPFNVEQVPAESLAVKFAEKDRMLHGMNYEIYSNQFIPLWVDCDIVDRIQLDGNFSKALTGGGISHLNIGEKLTHKNQMKRLIDYAISSGCDHFAVNYNFCRCQNNHVSVAGPVQTCPICAAPITEHYTRIIGYFTPVSAWNRGRQVEHGNRIFQSESAVVDQTHTSHLPKDTVVCKGDVSL
ncbi:MAG: Oxygen-sensitive ribonucleoside-triphosphate reductase [candidate division TM6 bacterium GW2011_GWF2_38_10]|nr:MAG: Oxygen-sensitive ribonucleoside-triphosphate reductase [candidate division TM6 bacterium GW2011_GWF2_38_10]